MKKMKAKVSATILAGVLGAAAMPFASVPALAASNTVSEDATVLLTSGAFGSNSEHMMGGDSVLSIAAGTTYDSISVSGTTVTIKDMTCTGNVSTWADATYTLIFDGTSSIGDIAFDAPCALDVNEGGLVTFTQFFYDSNMVTIADGVTVTFEDEKTTLDNFEIFDNEYNYIGGVVTLSRPSSETTAAETTAAETTAAETTAAETTAAETTAAETTAANSSSSAADSSAADSSSSAADSSAANAEGEEILNDTTKLEKTSVTVSTEGNEITSFKNEISDENAIKALPDEKKEVEAAVNKIEGAEVVGSAQFDIEAKKEGTFSVSLGYKSTNDVSYSAIVSHFTNGKFTRQVSDIDENGNAEISFATYSPVYITIVKNATAKQVIAAGITETEASTTTTGDSRLIAIVSIIAALAILTMTFAAVRRVKKA